MHIVFMGTPPFAATLLRRLGEWTSTPAGNSASLVGVYCQPDRPAGRGHKLTPPAVKVQAEAMGLPVLQPLNFREQADRDTLAALRPDVLVVAAYGLILPQAVLDIPRLGPWNVHASLLPRHRGAAPIERALMAGETHTGVTIMRMEAGLDTGPMALQRALGIGIHDTAANLLEELAVLGGDLMVETLETLLQGTSPTLIQQDSHKATYAAKLHRDDGWLDWHTPVYAVHAHLRGVTPKPGGRTVLRECGTLQNSHDAEVTQVLDASEGTEVLLSVGTPSRCPTSAEPGTVLPLRRTEAGPVLPVVCADGEYLIHELRPANRKAMSAEAFVNGFMPLLRPGGGEKSVCAQSRRFDPSATGQ